MVDVALRHKNQHARLERLPRQVAGTLKDAGEKCTFVPADEGLHPFELDKLEVEGIPRGVLLIATTAKRRTETGAVYTLGGPAEKPRAGGFVGVVDHADGKPFLVELGSKPPRAHALEVDHPEGMVVACEHTEAGVVLKETLAEAGTPAARCWLVLGSEGLEPTFPEDALTQARAIDQPKMLEGIKDLTHEPFFAIDNEGSRDIDQAMRLERLPNGNIRLSYALADMAAYVKPGTPLWELAMARGASFYLPHVCVGMQPPEVHERHVSLNAHEEHRALVFHMEIDPDGALVSRTVEQAKIRSRAQLTYHGVSAHLEKGAALDVDDHKKPVPAEVKEQLQLFRALGDVLMKQADARGVVEPERREMQIALDGERFFLKERHDDFASKLNAQLSILTNVVGAEALHEPGLDVPAIFKAHEAPWPRKLRALGQSVDAIVHAHGLPPAWKWRRRESLAAWVDRLKVLPRNDREHAIARALQAQVIAVQVPAQFTDEPRAHDGLKLARYGRFTAPMREAVGLVSHALLVQLERWRAAQQPGAPRDTVLWEHMMLGAVVDPAKLSPERRAAVERALALDGAGLVPITPEERALVDRAIDAAIASGNLAGQKQGRVDGAARRLLFDDLFKHDLGDPTRPAPLRTGTLMFAGDGQLRVALEDPLVEVKLSAQCAPKDGARVEADGKLLTIGGPVQIRATHHDGEKLVFALA